MAEKDDVWLDETYRYIIDYVKRQEFDNAKEAEIEVKKLLAERGLKGGELERVADAILRVAYKSRATRIKEEKEAQFSAEPNAAAEQAIKKFSVSRGDRNEIKNVAGTAWLFIGRSGPVPVDQLRENTRAMLYRHDMGHILNKYPGIFDYIFAVLTGMPRSSQPEKEIAEPHILARKFKADGTLVVRAFWFYRGESRSVAESKDMEVDADVFLETGARRSDLDGRFKFTERGYLLDRPTPVSVILPEGSYTILCEYSGTGQFEQRVQRAQVKVSAGKTATKNFYFEIIPAGGGGGGGEPRPAPGPRRPRRRAGEPFEMEDVEEFAPQQEGAPRPEYPEEEPFTQHPPAQPPALEPEARGPKHEVLIESWPIQTVKVNIYKSGAPTDADRRGLLNYAQRIAPGVNATQLGVLVDTFIKQHFENEEEARQWLESSLYNIGVRRPRNIANEIINVYFRRRRWLVAQTPFRQDLYEGEYILEFEGTAQGLNAEGKALEYTFSNAEAQPASALTSKTEQNPVKVSIFGNTRIVAYYQGKGVVHTDRPTMSSPYQAGVGKVGRLGVGARDNLTSAMALPFFKGRMNRQVERTTINPDPFINAAINKGKRIMNKYAKAEYTRIFEHKPDGIVPRYDQKKKDLNALAKKAKDARSVLKKELRSRARGMAFWKSFAQSDQDLSNAASAAIQSGEITHDLFVEARENLDAFMKARDDFFNNLNRDLESASVKLQDYMVQRADATATQIVRRYRIPLNSPDDRAVRDELRGYATKVAEDFATRGRTYGFALQRGMMNVSRSFQTFGAFGQNFLYNLWIFFTGPWVLMTIFVLIQFFFTLMFVGYSVQLLWVMPLITAIFTFFVNLSDTIQPLDWITHLSSGAAIGFSAMLFMVAFNAQSFSFIGSTSGLGFWIVWIILSFLGIFQFYQNGGYKTVLQGSLIILLFAYLALGPYQAYYHQVVDQAKAPIEIAYRAGERAITDVWLLATNPTEWYARQQVTNVRPERPLAFPKGLELATIEALPPSVPGGQQFALATVIKHDGIMDNVTDITLTVSCNQWCKSEFAIASPSSNSQIVNDTDSFRNTASPLTQRLPPDVKSGILTNNVFYVKDELKRGEAELVNVRNLVSTFIEGRQAEANFARVYFNLSYSYSTSSSLLVSVISPAELQRRFSEGDTVFKQVTAVSKTTPAQISINVGPQPLQAGSSSLLLIGISNTRDDSKVVLEQGTPITIRVPKVLVAENSGVKCDNFVSTTDPNYPAYHTVVYKMPKRAEVLAFEFQSIFAFVCSFTTSTNVDTVQTGLITAEMPYRFRLEQKKDIPVTPPLGIIYEPFEATCNEASSESACHAVAGQLPGNTAKTCYYENFDPATAQLVGMFGNLCHVCGSKPSCEKFLSQPTCDGEARLCGLSCEWDPNAVHPISDANLRGACKAAKVAATGLVADRVRSMAIAMKPANADDQVRAEGIANSFEEMVLKLSWHESTFMHCTDKTLNCINDNTYNSVRCSTVDGQRNSCGAMQISIVAHPDWRDGVAECGGKGAYDVDCNIRLGIQLLINNYNQFGARGNPDPACSDEPYRSKYISYSGWKAALRAYNGWGCPRDYPNGQDKAGNFVENVIAVNLASLPAGTSQQTQQAETCLSCTSKQQVWCTTSPASSTNGACILAGPCNPSTPNMISSSAQCPAETGTCAECRSKGFAGVCLSGGATGAGTGTTGQCARDSNSCGLTGFFVSC